MPGSFGCYRYEWIKWVSWEFPKGWWHIHLFYAIRICNSWGRDTDQTDIIPCYNPDLGHQVLIYKYLKSRQLLWIKSASMNGWTLMLLGTNFESSKKLNDAKMMKNNWNPGICHMGYSSESTRRELTNEYQHDRVNKMVFKNLCILVLWTKVALAFIGRVNECTKRPYPWTQPGERLPISG